MFKKCIEKLHVKQTYLLLNKNVNIDEFDVNPGHQCTFYDYKLCEEGSEIFDNLENLESSLSNEIKMALVYIAGYITRNDYQPSECEANFYYEKYGKYTNSTDRRKLKVSSDHTCRCLFFLFLFFFLLCFFFFFVFFLSFFFLHPFPYNKGKGLL